MTGHRLNLGCGRFPKAGFENVDWAAGPGVDHVADLATLPWPFEDNRYDLVNADHLFEHLPDVFGVMAEVHRILRPGGRLKMRVPHFSRGFTHAEHQRGFDVTFPFYFHPRFAGGYTGTPFVLRDMRMTWFAQPYLKATVMGRRTVRTVSLLGRGIDWAANRSPLLCSRTWCYLVGGFEEIAFEFEKATEAEVIADRTAARLGIDPRPPSAAAGDAQG
jgi:predicted SAM-dependent methyltransferase